MSTLPDMKWNPESYLAFERDSIERHEYLNGEVLELPRTNARHSLIKVSTVASLHSQLRQKPCIVYLSDMRLKVSQTGLYTYPDISVVCDPAQYEDDHKDILLNPTVIIEVLSPSTENYDRGKKFQHYRTLSSLQEYVLVAQDSIHVEHYIRQPDDQWLLSDINQPDGTFDLPSISCKLNIADIYEKVEFEGD